MRYVAVLFLGMTSSNARTSTEKSGWRKLKLLRNESQIVIRIIFPAYRTAEYQDPALRNVTPLPRRAKADATDLTSSPTETVRSTRFARGPNSGLRRLFMALSPLCAPIRMLEHLARV
jgi:hypothetical protein